MGLVRLGPSLRIVRKQDPSSGGTRMTQSGGRLLLLARLASFAARAALVIILARILGLSQYGEFAAGTSVALLPLVLGTLGVDQLQLRGDVTVDAAKRVTVSICLLVATVAIGFAACWPGLSGQGRWVALTTGVSGAVDMTRVPWLTQPLKELAFQSRARREVSCIAITILAIAVAGVLSGNAVVASGSGLAASFILSARIGFARPLSLVETRVLLQRSLPFALSGALYTIYFQIDGAMLAALVSSREVGLYRVAYLFVSAGVVLPVVMNNDMLRASLRAATRSSFGDVLSRSLRRNSIASVLMCVFVIFAGPPLVTKFLGGDYAGSRQLIPLLGLALLPHYFCSWAGNVFVAADRLKLVLEIQSALALANILLNLWLIPQDGPRGAAIATIATETLGAVAYASCFWRATRTKRFPHLPTPSARSTTGPAL